MYCDNAGDAVRDQSTYQQQSLFAVVNGQHSKLTMKLLYVNILIYFRTYFICAAKKLTVVMQNMLSFCWQFCITADRYVVVFAQNMLVASREGDGGAMTLHRTDFVSGPNLILSYSLLGFIYKCDD